MRRRGAWLVVGVLLLLAVGWNARPRSQALDDDEFSAWVEQCSEAPREFISDNWVSNETDYAEVVRQLTPRLRPGQVYIGVGPEQNFSYIAAMDPAYAFIVDVRRGNLLQHLFYKVLFETSDRPQQWLARLLGRSTPRSDDYATWLRELEALDPDPRVQAEVRQLLRARLQQWGLDLRRGDGVFLLRMQSVFAQAGLGLRFSYRQSQPEEPQFPTFGEVLRATDSTGQWGCFLAHPEAYQRLCRMQRENRIVPLVGDFASWRAFSKLSRLLHRRRLNVGLFYASNVEFYLMPRGVPGSGQEAFVFNLEALPTSAQSLLLRTRLAAPGSAHLFSSHAQLLQPFVQSYFAGEFASYDDCIQRDDVLSPASPAPGKR